ncbi:hypothetical protein IQ268_09070 [Oculatella sp. LEGE 06141]|uniref:hypothetical protein n=1 Tax=Oculatella sp. LEGE 06141 TaxID=1828648 RepID=UPI001881BA1C|nr:hypothetical protein [Oculatella sp. LEGE 06141]MBE9178710.1 hypothetical protein [Oculatella sp. LEGE 06141]
MIQGLRWRHIGWMCLFLLLLFMTATAEGAYRLNWQIASKSWQQLTAGGQGLWQKQTEVAQQLDRASQQRYGYDPIEPRSSECVTAPQSSQVLQTGELSSLLSNPPVSREDAIARLEQPYCQVVTGADIWLVGASQFLEVYYSPVSFQLREVEQ